jgi:hypothetical protein
MPPDFIQNKRRSRDGTADGSVQDESAIFDANVFKAGLLFDFDIDAQDLKPKHTAFLDESISFMVDRLQERLKSIQPGLRVLHLRSIPMTSPTIAPSMTIILLALTQDRAMAAPALADKTGHGFLLSHNSIDFPSGTFTTALGITGDIVGRTADASLGHGFLLSRQGGHTVTDLGTLPAGTFSQEAQVEVTGSSAETKLRAK